MGSVTRYQAVQIPGVLLPPVVAALAAFRQSPVWMLGAFGLVFAVVAMLPLCRCRESVWVFFLVMLVSAPVNLALIRWLVEWGMIDGAFWLQFVLRAGLYWCIFFCLEELICAFAARILWPRQRAEKRRNGNG